MRRAETVLNQETGEPDAVKVARPVRRGAGRKGGDIRPRLRPTLPRFRQQLTPSVSAPSEAWRFLQGASPC